MDDYMRSQKDIVGAADGIELNEQEEVSPFQYPSMLFQGDMDAIVDESEAVIFGGQIYELDNVLVPPSESEDCDLNDSVLKYISEILMEEDGEKESWMFQESAALQASEKSFYEALQEKVAPSPSDHQVPHIDQNVQNQDGNYQDHFSVPEVTNTVTDEYPFLNWTTDSREYAAAGHEPTVIISESASRSFCSPLSRGTSSSIAIDRSILSPNRILEIPSVFSNSETTMQFNKGVEEANKFLPVVDGFVTSAPSVQLQEMVREELTGGSETDVDNHRRALSHDNLRTRKYPHPEDVDLQEGRRNKQSAVFTESIVEPEVFDMVLLRDGEQTGSPAHETLKSGEIRNDPKVHNPKGSSGAKPRGKIKKGGRNAVNLKELLISCAQAVAAEDISTANQLLKQVREHSSPTGDGMQRLAHYFARGLEARISCTGNNIKALASLPPSASDVLIAYQVYLSACPFRRVSNFFANKTIMNVSEKATRLHIIHFGVLYGFQWPSFMQRLSSRPGGPPRLRITGIDVPRPGLKPAERVEETGRRLVNYALMYNIPFEFNAIAQNWETIKIEDLKLEEGEVLAVNCLYRMRILYDETVMTSSPRVNNPRNNVLNLIRKTNPDVFVLGVVNGAYNTPFFITRFREALFHFSSIFDMLDANIPCDVHGRMLIEKLMFGRQAINVIACEAGDRVERPETYKQWQVRNSRAGLSPLPLDNEIMKMAMQHVKISYHKDFSIIADGHWLVQGWRGRNLFALSSWKPAN